MPRSRPTPCSAWSSRCRAASAATCSPSSGMPRPSKLYGLNASGRSPAAAATIDLFKAKGLTEIPTHGPLSWSVPGCVDGWDQLRQAVRHQGLARAARAGDRVRGDTAFPSARSSPPTGAAPRKASRQIPTSAACFLPGGHAPGKGDGLPQPGPGPVAADHRRRTVETRFIAGRWPRRSCSYSQSVGGLFSLADFAEHTSDVRRAGLDQLPGLRRLGAAAQRPGDRGSPDAQLARAVRSEEHGARNRPRRCT